MDIRTDHPVGRVPDSARMRAISLRCTHDGWQLGRLRGGWHGTLGDVLPRLDTVHALSVGGTVPASAVDECATFIHRAVARGTFVSGLTDSRVRRALPTALAERIEASAPASVVGELDWDVRAVDQRRAALRPLLGPLPSVSLVLVSRRADLVVPAVRRIADLDYPRLEIVVGLHGVTAPPELAGAAGDLPLQVYEFAADEVYGSVLDQAFARASGELVGKVDDDDHLGADHAWDLVAAHRYSGATLVGKTTTVVYLEALDTTVRRVFGAREAFTHRVAGATMLLSREDLRAVGGWAPVPRAVDTALLEAVQRHGGTIYQPHDIGYLYNRGANARAHTWAAAELSHFLRNAREQWVGLLRHPAFGSAQAHPSPTLSGES